MKTPTFHFVTSVCFVSMLFAGCYKHDGEPYIFDKELIAAAGADQTIVLPETSVTLSGEGSTPRTGDLLYRWSVLGQGSCCTIKDPQAPTTVVENLCLGKHDFELEVSDYNGKVSRDTTSIYVNAADDVTNELVFYSQAMSCSSNGGCTITITEMDRLMNVGSIIAGAYYRKARYMPWVPIDMQDPGLNQQLWFAHSNSEIIVHDAAKALAGAPVDIMIKME